MSSAAELTPNANQKLIRYLNDAVAVENALEGRLQSRAQESIVEDTGIQLQKNYEDTRNQLPWSMCAYYSIIIKPMFYIVILPLFCIRNDLPLHS